eukprot:2287512-Rhodomonas_salina.1
MDLSSTPNQLGRLDFSNPNAQGRGGMRGGRGDYTGGGMGGGGGRGFAQVPGQGNWNGTTQQFSQFGPGRGSSMDYGTGGWPQAGPYGPSSFGPQHHPLPPPSFPPPPVSQLIVDWHPPSVPQQSSDQRLDQRADQPSNPSQSRSDESNPGADSLNPTRAIMEVLSQTLKTQGESAAVLQREQHAFLERMANKANDTQVRMMSILAGKEQPLALTEGGMVYLQGGMGAAGGPSDALDNSFDSRFEDYGEVESAAPPLIDSNFLIKELWDTELKADFAC